MGNSCSKQSDREQRGGPNQHEQEQVKGTTTTLTKRAGATTTANPQQQLDTSSSRGTASSSETTATCGNYSATTMTTAAQDEDDVTMIAPHSNTGVSTNPVITPAILTPSSSCDPSQRKTITHQTTTRIPQPSPLFEPDYEISNMMRPTMRHQQLEPCSEPTTTASTTTTSSRRRKNKTRKNRDKIWMLWAIKRFILDRGGITTDGTTSFHHHPRRSRIQRRRRSLPASTSYDDRVNGNNNDDDLATAEGAAAKVKGGVGLDGRHYVGVGLLDAPNKRGGFVKTHRRGSGRGGAGNSVSRNSAIGDGDGDGDGDGSSANASMTRTQQTSAPAAEHRNNSYVKVMMTTTTMMYDDDNGAEEDEVTTTATSTTTMTDDNDPKLQPTTSLQHNQHLSPTAKTIPPADDRRRSRMSSSSSSSSSLSASSLSSALFFMATATTATTANTPPATSSSLHAAMSTDTATTSSLSPSSLPSGFQQIDVHNYSHDEHDGSGTGQLRDNGCQSSTRIPDGTTCPHHSQTGEGGQQEGVAVIRQAGEAIELLSGTATSSSSSSSTSTSFEGMTSQSDEDVSCGIEVPAAKEVDGDENQNRSQDAATVLGAEVDVDNLGKLDITSMDENKNTAALASNNVSEGKEKVALQHDAHDEAAAARGGAVAVAVVYDEEENNEVSSMTSERTTTSASVSASSSSSVSATPSPSPLPSTDIGHQHAKECSDDGNDPNNIIMEQQQQQQPAASAVVKDFHDQDPVAADAGSICGAGRGASDDDAFSSKRIKSGCSKPKLLPSSSSSSSVSASGSSSSQHEQEEEQQQQVGDEAESDEEVERAALIDTMKSSNTTVVDDAARGLTYEQPRATTAAESLEIHRVVSLEEEEDAQEFQEHSAGRGVRLEEPIDSSDGTFYDAAVYWSDDELLHDNEQQQQQQEDPGRETKKYDRDDYVLTAEPSAAETALQSAEESMARMKSSGMMRITISSSSLSSSSSSSVGSGPAIRYGEEAAVSPVVIDKDGNKSLTSGLLINVVGCCCRCRRTGGTDGLCCRNNGNLLGNDYEAHEHDEVSVRAGWERQGQGHAGANNEKGNGKNNDDNKLIIVYDADDENDDEDDAADCDDEADVDVLNDNMICNGNSIDDSYCSTSLSSSTKAIAPRMLHLCRNTATTSNEEENDQVEDNSDNELLEAENRVENVKGTYHCCRRCRNCYSDDNNSTYSALSYSSSLLVVLNEDDIEQHQQDLSLSTIIEEGEKGIEVQLRESTTGQVEDEEEQQWLETELGQGTGDVADGCNISLLVLADDRQQQQKIPMIIRVHSDGDKTQPGNGSVAVEEEGSTSSLAALAPESALSDNIAMSSPTNIGHQQRAAVATKTPQQEQHTPSGDMLLLLSTSSSSSVSSLATAVGTPPPPFSTILDQKWLLSLLEETHGHNTSDVDEDESADVDNGCHRDRTIMGAGRLSSVRTEEQEQMLSTPSSSSSSLIRDLQSGKYNVTPTGTNGPVAAATAVDVLDNDNDRDEGGKKTRQKQRSETGAELAKIERKIQQYEEAFSKIVRLLAKRKRQQQRPEGGESPTLSTQLSSSPPQISKTKSEREEEPQLQRRHFRQHPSLTSLFLSSFHNQEHYRRLFQDDFLLQQQPPIMLMQQETEKPPAWSSSASSSSPLPSSFLLSDSQILDAIIKIVDECCCASNPAPRPASTTTTHTTGTANNKDSDADIGSSNFNNSTT